MWLGFVLRNLNIPVNRSNRMLHSRARLWCSLDLFDRTWTYIPVNRSNRMLHSRARLWCGLDLFDGSWTYIPVNRSNRILHSRARLWCGLDLFDRTWTYIAVNRSNRMLHSGARLWCSFDLIYRSWTYQLLDQPGCFILLIQVLDILLQIIPTSWPVLCKYPSVMARLHKAPRPWSDTALLVFKPYWSLDTTEYIWEITFELAGYWPIFRLAPCVWD